ncbi:hypothetical protein IID20_04895, partial [Patescibacteria group bacterium]|nr:hypothetical protein [Patescibacteria group bacterium]
MKSKKTEYYRQSNNGNRIGRQLFCAQGTSDEIQSRHNGKRSSRRIFLGGIFILLILFLVGSFTFNILIQPVVAYSPPSAPPPGNNVPKPINAGSSAQGRLGNLGIGTTIPTVELDVIGDIKVTGNITVPLFYDTNDVTFFLDPSASGTALNVKGIGLFLGTGNNYFAGNVGIGTASPQAVLHVWNGFMIADRNSNRLIFNPDYGALGNYASVYTYTNLPLAFGTNNDANQLFLATNGRFGIGTTDPQATLDVEGNISVSGNKVIDLGEPSVATDAATKNYVDLASGGGVGSGTVAGQTLR